MEIKSSKYYWNKFFRTKAIFGIVFALIPLTLLFTNVIMFATVGVVFISFIPLIMSYLLIYSPYKAFIANLQNPAKKVHVNIVKDSVHLNGKTANFYQVQFCDDPSLTYFACEFADVSIDDLKNVECYLFNDGKSIYASLINENETVFLVVRIPDRPVNFLDSTM